MNRSFFVLVTLIVVVFGCAPPPDPNKPDTTCDAMPGAVTMATLHTGLFAARCGMPCHYPASGGMLEGTGFPYGDYTTPAKTQMAMVNKGSLYMGSAATLKVVAPNDLGNSSLWLKLSAKTTVAFKGPKGENTGGRMPNDGTMLTPAELKQVKDWICTGAKEN